MTKLKLAASFAASIFAGNALAAATDVLPIKGYFQTYGVQWGGGPSSDTATLDRGQSLHYVKDDFSDAASLVYFPNGNIQVHGLAKNLRVDMFLAPGSSCGAGSPRITIVLEDPENPAATTADETQVFVYLNSPSNCKVNQWQTLDYTKTSKTYWSAGSLGLGSNTGRGAVHHAAVARFGSKYRVSRVRLNFDGEAGPEAWFDNFAVHDRVMNERIQDFSPESQIPAAPEIDALKAASAGHFQARNVKWGNPPGLFTRLAKGQAMRFSPDTRTEDIDFMSTSFFPQGEWSLDDINSMSADVYYANRYCSSTAPIGSFGSTIILQGTSGNELRLEGRWTKNCASQKWQTRNLLSNSMSWTLSGYGAVSGLDAAHSIIAAMPGMQNYSIAVMRLHQTGAAVDLWLDHVKVNAAVLREQINDWSLETHF